MPELLVIGETLALLTPAAVLTVLPDGDTVRGVPHDTDEYRATAQRLGYGADTVRLNLCHELTHSLLAKWLGLPCSPVFERVARGEMAESEITRLEETAVCAVEAFANAVGARVEDVARGLVG